MAVVRERDLNVQISCFVILNVVSMCNALDCAGLGEPVSTASVGCVAVTDLPDIPAIQHWQISFSSF